MDEQFGRDQRILTGSDYRRVFAKPKRVSGRAFTVLACPGSTEHGRLGLAVSKKVDKRAVKRNQIKRLVRETFRRNAIRRSPIDLVVIARTDAAKMPADKLIEQLRQHYDRIVRQFDQPTVNGESAPA
ncbi:MAG: ribonuclease P protein component [Lysobacterales bacterium]